MIDTRVRTMKRSKEDLFVFSSTKRVHPKRVFFPQITNYRIETRRDKIVDFSSTMFQDFDVENLRRQAKVCEYDPRYSTVRPRHAKRNVSYFRFLNRRSIVETSLSLHHHNVLIQSKYYNKQDVFSCKQNKN